MEAAKKCNVCNGPVTGKGVYCSGVCRVRASRERAKSVTPNVTVTEHVTLSKYEAAENQTVKWVVLGSSKDYIDLLAVAFEGGWKPVGGPFFAEGKLIQVLAKLESVTRNVTSVTNNSSTDPPKFVPTRPDPELGYRCCQGKSPCKHWTWNTEKSVYINTLTGKEKEPL